MAIATANRPQSQGAWIVASSAEAFHELEAASQLRLSNCWNVDEQ